MGDKEMISELVAGIMTPQYDEYYKPTLFDLEHHGVKGMRWGQHLSRLERDQAIKGARKNLKIENKQFKQDVKAVKRSGVDRKTRKSEIKQLRNVALKNPDRITASRTTSGEKYLLAGLAILPGGPLIVGTNVAARHFIRKHIQNNIDAG